MNWYKLIKLAQLSGEFWIDESGNAIYADGDVGDYNHEGYVIETVQHQIMDGEGDWDEFKMRLAQQAFQQEMQQAVTPEQKQMVQEKWDADEGYTFVEEALQRMQISPEALQIADGHGDAVLYALKFWGWKRIRTNQVDTWTITSQDMKILANGLWDAYQEEAEMSTFDIDVRSTRGWYNDVPFEVISSEDPGQLRIYTNVTTH